MTTTAPTAPPVPAVPTVEAPVGVGIEYAARTIGLTTWQIRGLIKSGRLPATKLGRTWVIRVDDLHALLDGKTAQGSADE